MLRIANTHYSIYGPFSHFWTELDPRLWHTVPPSWCLFGSLDHSPQPLEIRRGQAPVCVCVCVYDPIALTCMRMCDIRMSNKGWVLSVCAVYIGDLAYHTLPFSQSWLTYVPTCMKEMIVPLLSVLSSLTEWPLWILNTFAAILKLSSLHQSWLLHLSWFIVQSSTYMMPDLEMGLLFLLLRVYWGFYRYIDEFIQTPMLCFVLFYAAWTC